MRFLRPILLTAVLGLVALWLWAGDAIVVRPFCPFHKIFGIPCPGCGGVRAITSLLHGQVTDALKINPMAILFSITVVAVVACSWWDAIHRTQIVQNILHKPWPPLTTALGISVIVANWIWNIAKGI